MSAQQRPVCRECGQDASWSRYVDRWYCAWCDIWLSPEVKP